MTSPNNFIIEEEEGDGDASNEVQTIFSDLITFIMMLFILLFVLSFNDNATGNFFSQMAEKFGGRES
ncbi:hypothetical protein DID80_08360, partial [Candidatus Marinamargulisbacteria bacterium SCGC AAA071-K20]